MSTEDMLVRQGRLTAEAIEGARARHPAVPIETALLEDGLIDEAVLRDMVAQLVREELRGSLGERITQNVRKLVRREIQRALLGQDYD